MKWGIGSIFLLIRHWVGRKKRRRIFILQGGMGAAASLINFLQPFSTRLSGLFSVFEIIYDCIV